MSTSSPDPFAIDAGDYPTTGSRADQIRFLLGYAVLAPSGHNTQPWRFRIGADTVEVIADRTRALPVVDPHDRELAISCGAAIGTFEVAARNFGLAASVVPTPDADDPDLLARLRITEGGIATADDTTLFRAICRRRTNRTAYAMSVLPAGLVDACRDDVASLGVTLSACEDGATRRAVAALVAEGDRRQFDDPSFRRELALWIHSARLGARDGMSGAGFGMPDLLSGVGRFMIRTFDLGGSVAAADEKKILEGSPMLFVLGSPGDRADHWVNTGRALSRVLLRLTSRDIAASYLNQPIEVESLRPQLREVVGMSAVPQLLLRVGRGQSHPAATVRRDLDEVLLD